MENSYFTENTDNKVYRIKFIEPNYYFTSHRNFSHDKIDSKTTVVCGHEDKNKEGQKYYLRRVCKGIYEIIYVDKDYGMLGWGLNIDKIDNNNYKINMSSCKRSAFKFIVKENQSYLMKDVLYGTYIYVNKDDKRDSYSRRLGCTKNEEKATAISFKQEQIPSHFKCENYINNNIYGPKIAYSIKIIPDPMNDEDSDIPDSGSESSNYDNRSHHLSHFNRESDSFGFRPHLIRRPSFDSD